MKVIGEYHHKKAGFAYCNSLPIRITVFNKKYDVMD
jgi:hypothetical protein